MEEKQLWQSQDLSWKLYWAGLQCGPSLGQVTEIWLDGVRCELLSDSSQVDHDPRTAFGSWVKTLLWDELSVLSSLNS